MKKWMKKLTGGILCAVIGFSAFSSQEVYAAEKEQLRAVWISTVYSADYPSSINDPSGQKNEFIRKLDAVQAMGLNTVVVQVRPKGDAFYESALNPWSAVLTGTQGKYPGYDPMAFMIEETHKRGMEFHAWMNPYRITTSGTDLSQLSADNMARKHPDWVLTYNNAMYFNPAREEVKEYICDTVAEIVENYAVDAIHFDDYFYPSNYPLPEGEGKEGAVAAQRRNHVDDLIQGVYRTIKEIDASVAFGISPMGIWKNSKSDPAGSATKGAEGYYTVYGDAKKWVEKGWVDYIVPQIYWERGNAAADYETLVKWWHNVVQGTGVDLYIGHGIYKDVVAAEISSQLSLNEKYDVDGSFFFSLRDLLDNRKGCGDAVKQYYAQNTAEEKPMEQPAVNQTIARVERKTAYAGRAKVTVDGKTVDFQTYTIDDYTYFKLRDIAFAINGTSKQFMTFWDEETQSIQLVRRAPYTAAGSGGVGRYGDAVATTSTARLFCDAEEVQVDAYTIHDYTYYKLRDIAKLIDMGITWNENTMTIGMETEQSYE